MKNCKNLTAAIVIETEEELDVYQDCFNQIPFCLSFETLNSQIFSFNAKLDFLLDC